MDRRTGQIADAIIEQAFRYDDPDSSFDRARRTTCPECSIPLDDAENEMLCPWCGARNPDAVQALMWAELQAMEQAWPEALGA